MKKLNWILGFLIISFAVSAINVDLITPPNGAQLQYEINSIQFTCKVPGAEVVKLYTDINGSWSHTGSTIYGNNIAGDGSVTFTVMDVPEGSYDWNCFADQLDFASSNFSYNFQFPPNEPPECAISFPIVVLQKNAGKTNVLNLNDYFTDPEDDDLTFAFSGNNNVDITVKSSGSIDLMPKLDRVATDSIYFRADDGKSGDVPCSNPLIVTIEGGDDSVVDGNSLEITPTIPDQSKDMDVSFWEIDLDDYVEYDSGLSELTWTVENVGNDVVNITINDINNEVRFEPIGAGTDNILFVVTGPGDLEADQSVEIMITSGADESETEEDLDELVDPDIIKIESHTPGSSDPLLESGGSLEFSVEVSESDYEIIWYVDGEQVEEDSDTFEFTPEDSGDYVISVSVSKDGEDDDYEWDVKVVGTIDEEDVVIDGGSELCGNGEFNEGEDCSSCPEDMGCESSEKCVEGECVVSNKITGFSIKDLEGGKLIGVIIVGVILVLFIAILIIRTSNIRKARSKNRTLSSFEPRIKEETKPVKEEHILKKIENVDTAPAGRDHIIGFIQSGLASGDNKKEIKKALIRGGWNRKQIKGAFGNIKK